jgi:hypothetical protein
MQRERERAHAHTSTFGKPPDAAHAALGALDGQQRGDPPRQSRRVATLTVGDLSGTPLRT